MAIIEVDRERVTRAATTVVAHVCSSGFVGGPERQMLGMAAHLGDGYRSIFFPFDEGGRSRPLVDECARQGFSTRTIRSETPHFRAMIDEVAGLAREAGVDVLVAHSHKADVLGLAAARKAKIPIVSVSHGWTGECLRQKAYDLIDRAALHFMDAVACVSEAQARKVRRIGVPRRKIAVIRNAIDPRAIAAPSAGARARIERLFEKTPRFIVGAAGRLSPEKGFEQLVSAARLVVARNADTGFVLFGDGAQRSMLERLIESAGLRDRFILAGFTQELPGLISSFDVVALPSYTEGLPVVVLEAMAGGVPVVATAVGGTPEVVVDGETGYLVAPRDPLALAERIDATLVSETARLAFGAAGRRHVEERFSFNRQAEEFRRLFASLGA